MSVVRQKITPFLMFEGFAEEAMRYYISLFDNSSVEHILYHDDGTVLHATFILNGQSYMCIDSAISHDFKFTPSMSLFVECESLSEIENLFEKLSTGGEILMPISETPVSEKFGWVNDRFGVSWQLNLAKK